ncbi:hypothetical protein G7046_g3446 [Stylonectria norvegica]|nr:hypothetical protein G7046_g3446 [Stylonectria norvegica]
MPGSKTPNRSRSIAVHAKARWPRSHVQPNALHPAALGFCILVMGQFALSRLSPSDAAADRWPCLMASTNPMRARQAHSCEAHLAKRGAAARRQGSRFPSEQIGAFPRPVGAVVGGPGSLGSLLDGLLSLETNGRAVCPIVVSRWSPRRACAWSSFPKERSRRQTKMQGLIPKARLILQVRAGIGPWLLTGFKSSSFYKSPGTYMAFAPYQDVSCRIRSNRGSGCRLQIAQHPLQPTVYSDSAADEDDESPFPESQ